MNEYLVIRLDPAPAETASWVAVDATGALLGPVGSGSLTDAAAAAHARPVIALVPALEVLRTRAELPLKGSGKLLQALPFALEEQLAEDVEELHFAAGRREADGLVPVAVARRKLVRDWLDRLTAAGVAPQRMYSEGDALGVVPNTATLLVEHGTAVLAEADGSITAMDSDGVADFLDLWLSRRAASVTDGSPVHLVVYGVPETIAAQAPAWERVRSRVESIDLRNVTDGVLPRLAAQIVTAPGINLLQGEFAQRRKLVSLSPAWQVAAGLLLALGVLILAVQFAELRGLRREIAAVDADIDQAFHYVFPDAGEIGDARSELSDRLQQLGERSAGGGRDFLDVLRVIAQALGANSAARLEAINYRGGILELRVRAPNVETLDRIQQVVSQGGSLKAQIQSANAAGDGVVGRLQITRAGS